MHPRRTAADIVRKYGIFIALALLCAYFAIRTEDHCFLGRTNLLNIPDQVARNLILAVGMTFVIISAGIDLSVGSTLALASTLAAGILTHGLFVLLGGTRYVILPVLAVGAMVPLSMLFGILAGAASGAFAGAVITRFAVPPFIATLAMMFVTRGLANTYAGPGGRFGNLPDEFKALATLAVGPVALPTAVAVLVVVIGHLVLSQTAFGRSVYAVGGHEEAARLSGIRVRRVKMLVYTACGALAGIGGLIEAVKLGAGDPTIGNYAELDAIAAVVVGGASLMGGSGSMGRTLLGALFMGVLNNGLVLLRVPEFNQLIWKGVVILGAVILDQATRND